MSVHIEVVGGCIQVNGHELSPIQSKRLRKAITRDSHIDLHLIDSISNLCVGRVNDSIVLGKPVGNPGEKWFDQEYKDIRSWNVFAKGDCSEWKAEL